MNTRTDQVAPKTTTLQLWRGQHQTPARIPEGIWNEAVALAQELGVIVRYDPPARNRC